MVVLLIVPLALVGFSFQQALVTSFSSWAVALAISLLQDNLVNVLAHTEEKQWPKWMQGWFVSRSFALPDRSVNLPILAWLGWGQFLHNNHHARPGNFSFVTPPDIEVPTPKARWLDFDPCVLLQPFLRLGAKRPQVTNKNKPASTDAFPKDAS